MPPLREHVVIEPSGIVFLLIVCIGVPYLAWKTNRRLGGRPLPMSPRRFFLQTIFAQLYLVFLAVFAAVRNGVNLLALPPQPWRAYGLAALFLAILLGVMSWRWPHRDRQSKERVVRLLPRQRSELPLYFALCAAAGICEEIVYRGVTTALLARLTGSLAAAIAIAAVVFALAHVVQGRRATIAIVFIALGAHALVLVTRSLFPVMAAHALYDAIAGVLMPRWYRRELESAPPLDLSQTTPMR